MSLQHSGRPAWRSTGCSQTPSCGLSCARLSHSRCWHLQSMCGEVRCDMPSTYNHHDGGREHQHQHQHFNSSRKRHTDSVVALVHDDVFSVLPTSLSCIFNEGTVASTAQLKTPDSVCHDTTHAAALPMVLVDKTLLQGVSREAAARGRKSACTRTATVCTRLGLFINSPSLQALQPLLEVVGNAGLVAAGQRQAAGKRLELQAYGQWRRNNNSTRTTLLLSTAPQLCMQPCVCVPPEQQNT